MAAHDPYDDRVVETLVALKNLVIYIRDIERIWKDAEPGHYADVHTDSLHAEVDEAARWLLGPTKAAAWAKEVRDA